jgi:hypothetical protein
MMGRLQDPCLTSGRRIILNRSLRLAGSGALLDCLANQTTGFKPEESDEGT